MHTYRPDDGAERIQRALNESKREALRDRFGMTFGHVSEDIPAELEADFLSYVEEFELQWENASKTTVRAFIDAPVVRPSADVADGELDAEIERLTEIMMRHGIHLDFMYDVAPREVYRFLVEELLDEEMDDIRIEGMCHGFIYEEFHPNLERDAEQICADVTEGLLGARTSWITSHCTPVVRVGEDTDVEPGELHRLLVVPATSGSVVTFSEAEATLASIDDGAATVDVRGRWEGQDVASGKPASGDVRWRMSLQLEYDNWWTINAIDDEA